MVHFCPLRTMGKLAEGGQITAQAKPQKAARGRSMKARPTQSREGVKGGTSSLFVCPLQGAGTASLLGLGATPQLPLVPPAMPNALKYAPLVAGSEASLRTNSRVRRRGIPLPLIILFSNSPAPSACAFSFGNRINSPLSGHSTRAGAFLSPMEEHSHD